MKKEVVSDEVNLGFQIAPMIDVVFVIMLYFMVMASSVKKEQELKTALPSVATANNKDEAVVPDEITIIVNEDGGVTMNEEEMDSPTDKKLPTLTQNLARLKIDADSGGRKVLVTVQTEEQAKYERVIDVLNSLTKARIENVTFTVGNADQ
jgi:biopolymer transport protein ExbD